MFNTYSETALAPQSKTFPARSPFTRASCLSFQSNESKDSITPWKHFNAMPFSFCFIWKKKKKKKMQDAGFTDEKFLPSTDRLSPTFKHSPLGSRPLMNQRVTVLSLLSMNKKKKSPWILIQNLIHATEKAKTFSSPISVTFLDNDRHVDFS